MEAKVLSMALSARSGRLAQRTTTLHHRADAEGERSGLICAGQQTMVYFNATPEQARTYRRFADAVDTQEDVELRIDASTPTVTPVLQRSDAPIRLVGERYIEHALNPHRVAIVGGGHCGLALSRVMRQLGYHVSVFETRADLFTFTGNDDANELIVVDDFSEAASRVRHPKLTHFVVMTAGLPTDVRALLGCLRVEFPFKGVMGSAAKVKRIQEELLAEGAPNAALGALRGPIGIPMASNTPEEIAISVAGQILSLREELFPWTRPSSLS